jgi:hypothetical protein
MVRGWNALLQKGVFIMPVLNIKTGGRIRLYTSSLQALTDSKATCKVGKFTRQPGTQLTVPPVNQQTS